MRTYDNNRNPILPPDIHIPDGEPHVMSDGKLYVYGSYDADMENYCSGEYHVVSTPDGKHWTVHDTSFSAEDVPWILDPSAKRYGTAADWTHPTPFMMQMIQDMIKDMSPEQLEEMARQQVQGDATENEEGSRREGANQKRPLLFAPDCIEKDGNYYLYFCTESGMEGVAVSDRPEGPFRDPVRLPCGGIDPAVFIDDDGQAYYYWDQFFSSGVPLNEDMVSFDTEKVVKNLVTEEQHYFHEGSSMRKIGDTYYYIFADVERGKPTALGYATSDSPLGPFTYRGIIIDNADCDPDSWNNHGSIACFNGQWIVCYHRSSRNSRMNRRLCMEKIRILEDGTIPEVKMTSQGLGDPFGPGERIEGYRVCGLRGNAFVGGPEGEAERIVGICPGDEMMFRYLQGEPVYTELELESGGSGQLEVWLDDCLAAEISVCGEGKATVPLDLTGLERKDTGYEIRLVCRRAEKLEIPGMRFLA